MGRSPYLDKKLDEANRDRSPEELRRLASSTSQTQDQRASAQRVLKEGEK